MAVTKNTPEIRFQGFSEEWEEKRFEVDIESIQTGTNLLGAESNKGMPLLKMGNIKRGYFSTKKLEFLATNTEVEKENIAYYGDFFFNTRNTLELVGKGATWMGESDKFAFNSNIARFKFRGIDTIFFNYLYNTQDMLSQVHARAMGTTSVAAIYPRNLNSIEYKLPEPKEQSKIGSYFQNLDNLITQHQKKYDKLKNIKKAMLEKMFPQAGADEPEIRFKGFSGKWEEKSFGEIFDYERPDHYIVKYDDYSDSFHIPVLTANKGFILGYTNETRTYNYKSIIFDDFTLDCKYIDFPYMVKSSAIKILTLKDENQYNLRFAFELLKSSKIEIMGHARHYISVVQKTVVFVPSKKEQDKISVFFKNLDKLIKLNQQEIKKLKNIKKAMLEKMFV